MPTNEEPHARLRTAFLAPSSFCPSVFFILFFYSCLMSMCNPVGYDRLKHLNIQRSSLAEPPLVFHFCAVSPRLIHDIWELYLFSPPNSICPSVALATHKFHRHTLEAPRRLLRMNEKESIDLMIAEEADYLF